MRGTIWAVFGQVTSALLQLATSILLTRALVPSELGAFAYTLLVFTAVALVTDACVFAGLIARPTFDTFDLRGGARTSLALAAIGAAVIGLSAPAVNEWVFDGVGDVAQLHLVALIVVIAALVHAPRAALVRDRRFRGLASVDVLAAMGGAAAALSTLEYRQDSWALFAQLAVTLSLRTLGCVALAGSAFLIGEARPRFLREHFPFMRGVYASNVIVLVARNLDTLLVGRGLGATALGLYTRAFTLLIAPLQQLQLALGAPAVRALAFANANAALPSVFRQLLLGLGLTCAPVLIALALWSDLLVRTVFGVAWLGAANLTAAFALAGLFQAVLFPIPWTLQVVSRTDRMPLQALLTLVPLLGVATGVVAADLDLIALLYAVLGGPVILGLNLVLNRDVLPISAWRYIGCVVVASAPATCAAVAVLLVPAPPAAEMLAFLLACVIGTCALLRTTRVMSSTRVRIGLHALSERLASR